MECDNYKDFMLLSDNELENLCVLDLAYRNLKDSDLSQEFICRLNKSANLTTLSLHDNQLTTLPENVFDKLVKLKNLNLHDNQLTTFPENVFNELVNLRYLCLARNKLTTLPDNIFNSLVNLKLLHLADNKLTTLPANIFNSLVNLKDLFLSNNELTTLPANIFDKLINLECINYSGIELNNNMLKIGNEKNIIEYWIDNIEDIAYQRNARYQSNILIYKTIINKYCNQYKNNIK